MTVEQIKHRITKRLNFIERMESLNKIDKASIGEYEIPPLNNETIMDAILTCAGTDFETVFRKHKASGKLNRDMDNVRLRQMYFNLSQKFTLSTLKQTARITHKGKLIKLYHHSTIMHGVIEHNNLIECYTREMKFHKVVLSYLSL